MLKGKTVIMGICGGIAVYKALEIISQLRKLNADIHVIMTSSACKFVNPLTFQSLSNNYVVNGMFDEPKTFDIEHIALAKKADVFLIVPATANIIGKIAGGIADDMLSTTVMATRAPVLIAPAMNTNMYVNPIVQHNIKKLKELNYKFIEPATGHLACGDEGVGKLAETDYITECVIESLIFKKDLKGVNIMVTAGPTRESLDPVRFITNHSSGKMGYAIAKAAKFRGAKVSLISGPTNLPDIKGIDIKKINSAEEMFESVKERFNNVDIIIKAAAVSDYRPAKVYENKIKKEEDLEMKLIRNPDILRWIGEHKTNQVVAGFSMETENLVSNSIKKLKAKNIDFIVANDLTKEGAGFNCDTNIVKIIDRDGNVEELPLMSKLNIGNNIIDKAFNIYKHKFLV